MAVPRVYLAGPDVFLPEEVRVILVREKKRILASLGMVGCAPLDNVLDLDGKPLFDAGVIISKANEDMMRSCDGILANLTPFRGVSADVGTAFEVGFMRALGKTIASYSADGETFARRVAVAFPPTCGTVVAVPTICSGNMHIESFDMIDNLMLHGASPIFSPTSCLGGAIPLVPPACGTIHVHPDVAVHGQTGSLTVPDAAAVLTDDEAALLAPFQIAQGLDRFAAAARHLQAAFAKRLSDAAVEGVYA